MVNVGIKLNPVPFGSVLVKHSVDAQKDPVVLGPGDKIIRGGGIGTAPRLLRSAARYAVPRDIDYYGMLGLRLVLAPKVEVDTGK